MNYFNHSLYSLLSIFLSSTIAIYATDGKSHEEKSTYIIQNFKISQLPDNIDSLFINFPGTDTNSTVIASKDNVRVSLPLPFKYNITGSEKLIRDLRVQGQWRQLDREDLKILVHENKCKRPRSCVEEKIFGSLTRDAYPQGTYTMEIGVENLGAQPIIHVSYSDPRTFKDDSLSK